MRRPVEATRAQENGAGNTRNASQTSTPAPAEAGRRALGVAPANIRLQHIAILRDQLGIRGKIPLSLTSHERFEWAARGMTLKQRDEAAAELVGLGAAAYLVLKDHRFTRPGSDAVVDLVVAEGGR